MLMTAVESTDGIDNTPEKALTANTMHRSYAHALVVTPHRSYTTVDCLTFATPKANLAQNFEMASRRGVTGCKQEIEGIGSTLGDRISLKRRLEISLETT